MKKLTITCTLMLLFAVLFSACNNVFEPGEIPGLIKDGYGQVTINIEGVNARTTYPAAVFDDVEYTFTQGGVSKEPVSNNGTTYTLETGANWVVTVKGYKTVGTVKTLVAQGSSSSFSIATGSNPAVSVKLSIVDAVSTQNGTLTIAITKPNDATMTLLLEDMFSSDTPDIVNGENTIAAGIYLLTVNLELPGGETKYAGTGEIVYIYPHMTTSFSRTFAEADFSVWQAFRDITAAQLVSEIKIGWNLGNTFEAAHMTWLGENPTVTQMETGWGNPVTTKANIDALKTAGFNAIRIPVTWIKAADSNYNIRTDWMARITEVVNYAVANDMYIFLNTHHDEEDVYDFSDEGVEASLSVYKKIWEQIADNFKYYNEKLIFEGLNEPRTRNIPEGTSPNEWSGGTAEERANLNKYYQAFVDTVRTSGGNNDKRILMINTYGAFSGAVAVNAVVLPTDTVANKLIVTIHGYVPYNFAYPESTTTWSSSNPSDTDPVLGVFQPAYDKFVSQGVPVIIGEFGTVDTNHDGTTNVLADRAAYTEYYVSQAKAKGIKCVIFDNGIHIYSAEDNTVEVFGLLNRTDNTWRLPEIIAALMRGADADVSTPTPPTTITGNLGNYRFGTNDGVNYTNYDQAVWELTPTQVTTAQSAGAKLVLQLSGAPSARLDLVWQNPDTESYWNEKGILGENGNILNGSSVTWNANTLTINLDANTVEDYADTFTSAASLNLIIVYYGGSSVNDLGIVSANLVAEGGGANVITNPAPSVYGEENQTITSISDGVVSVNNPAGTNTGAGFSYEFPSDWATYTTVTIDYTLTITAGTAAKVTLKSGKNSYEGDIELNGVQYSQYQDFTGTGGTLVLQTVWFDDTKMDTPGISFQVNNYELAADMTFTFKVNSLTFE